jgi:hypothetical protein
VQLQSESTPKRTLDPNLLQPPQLGLVAAVGLGLVVFFLMRRRKQREWGRKQWPSQKKKKKKKKKKKISIRRHEN